MNKRLLVYLYFTKEQEARAILNLISSYEIV